MVAGPRRKLAIAHRAKLAPESVARDGEREFIPDPLRQIGKPPTHHAMRRRDRSRLDNRRKPGALLIVQDRGPPRRFACCQTIEAALVEPQDPVAHDLKRHTSNLRRVTSAPAVQDQRYRQ